MSDDVVVRPPNSLVLVMDPQVAVVPDRMDQGLVAATESCVAVGTLAEHDGPTHIRLVGSGSSDLGVLSDEPIWDGTLRTLDRVSVVTVFGEELLSLPAEQSSRVRVWANHPTEPDELFIVVGE